MHLALACCSILAAWKWGDWRNWPKYHPTLLFIVCMALLYEFFTKDYPLWVFDPDFVANHSMVVLLYGFVTMPANVLIFLSRFPTKWSRKLLNYGLWILLYIGVELILYLTGRMSYKHHWSLLWSFVFDLIMFPMLRLHYVNPQWAYILAVPIIAGYLFIFKVPVS